MPRQLWLLACTVWWEEVCVLLLLLLLLLTHACTRSPATTHALAQRL